MALSGNAEGDFQRMAIKQNFTLICDEVRREDNGKLMILGVYTPDIAVPQIPVVLPTLTFFQSLQSDRAGNWNITMRLQHLETRANVFEVVGGIGFQVPGCSVHPIRFANVQFTTAGVYSFIQEIEGQAEPLVTQFSVVLSILHAPSGPVQMVQ
jgi:hypothetical protein